MRRLPSRAAAYVLALAILFPLYAFAAGVVFDPLDVTQGLQGVQSSQAPFGYLTVLGVGGQWLPADLTVRNAATGSPMKVAGILGAFSWSGRSTDSVTLRVSVSATNLQNLGSMPVANVTFAYVVYNYALSAKGYFLAARGAGTLYGLVKGVNRVGDGVVPQLYEIELTISPDPKHGEQSLQYAPSPTMSVVNKWGVNVAN